MIWNAKFRFLSMISGNQVFNGFNLKKKKKEIHFLTTKWLNHLWSFEFHLKREKKECQRLFLCNYKVYKNDEVGEALI